MSRRLSRFVYLNVLISLALLALACTQERAAVRPDPGLSAGPPDLTVFLPAYETEWEKKRLNKGDEASFKALHPEWFQITIPPQKSSFRAMREWEPMESVMLSIADYTSSSDATSWTLADIVTGAWPVGKVYLVYESSSAKSSFTSMLQQNGVPANEIGPGKSIEFVQMQNDAIWIMDFGPFPLVDDDQGSVAFLDWKYYPSRYHDDAVPTRLGELWGITTYRQDFSFEGGNFQADGYGTCYTTERALENTGVSTSALAVQLEAYLSCTQLVVLKDIHDDGTGHIDMFFKLIAKDEAILGSFTSSQDYTSMVDMNENQDILESVDIPGGGSMTVHRMPHPNHYGNTPRTYLNSTLFNQRNLWPNYSIDKDIEADAVAVWESAMPTYTHVAINSDQISLASGAIHCVTRTVPAKAHIKWVSDGNCVGGACSAPQGGYTGSCDASGDCFGPQWMSLCVASGDCEDPCEGVTYEGCCEGQTVVWCENGELKSVNCDQSDAGPSCGWSASDGWYWCGTDGGVDPSGQFPKDCGEGPCEPDCNGISCGVSDGCGGVCGCADGGLCVAGICVTCQPSCAGKVCGDDGCGGSCGACPTGHSCNDDFQCEDPCQGITFEGCCDGEITKWCEDGALKQTDCVQHEYGVHCGWVPDKDWYFCGSDGGADPSGGFPMPCPGACQPSCSGKECGSDGCGGSCGACGSFESCESGLCICYPDCDGKQCGPDGCGGLCGSCGSGDVCQGGVCVCTPACAGAQCGSDGCGGSCGACPAGQECQAGLCKDGPCVADCSGKQCGGDGCGGSCGACPSNYECNGGLCKPGACVPSCGDKACGDDGCGGSCGTCAAGEGCTQAGQCICLPDCAGKICGADGCDGTCGACDPGEACTAGLCVCQADCAGRICGDDGCGGTCGVCPAGESCTDAGQCDPGACVPDCAGKACGTDGCGGTCGQCDDHNACTQDSCQAGQCLFDVAAKDGLGCPDDGLPCTADTCQGGACGHTLLSGCLISGTCYVNGDAHPWNPCKRCQDSNPSAWTHRLDGSPCDDQNLCTPDDICLAGGCTGTAPVVCAAVDACHKSGSCDPSTGACPEDLMPNGTPCDDGDAATGQDHCEAGACLGAPCDCQSVNACCDGCWAHNQGGACEDGDPCSLGDACADGICVAGAPKVCEPGDACHAAGVCDPQSGQCSKPTQPDGTICDDGDAATQDDHCDNGMCVGAGCTCSGVNACCDGCQPLADGAPCDDGDPCTQTDACSGGACEGADPLTCVAPDVCHQAGSCDSGTGACADLPLPDGTPCDDGDAATGDDACVAGACVGDLCSCTTIGPCCDGCFSHNEGGTCDDGDLCTLSEVCQGGQCQSMGNVDCVPLDECHDPGVCDPTTGYCDYPAVPDQTPCEGGACVEGVCLPEGCVCASVNACCDGCEAKNDGGACDDLDVCTSGETCAAGRCGGGAVLPCEPSGPCVASAACDAQTGACVEELMAEDSACDDQDPCTSDDRCTADGTCEGTAGACGPDAIEVGGPDSGGSDEFDGGRSAGGGGCSVGARPAPGILALLMLLALALRLRRQRA